MNRRARWLFLPLLLLAGSLGFAEAPQEFGKWTIEIGPPGNEFYQGPEKHGAGTDPGPDILRWAETIAPGVPLTVKGKLDEHAEGFYLLQSENDALGLVLLIHKDGWPLFMSRTDKQAGITESSDQIVPKGRKSEIEHSQLPEKFAATLKVLMPESPVEKAWYADTLVGPRYIAKAGPAVLFATPSGMITGGGAAGWADTEVPADTTMGPTAGQGKHTGLAPYEDRFNKDKQLDRLRQNTDGEDGSFRFIIMGDTRSQFDLWDAILQHIDTLEPRPAFVINSGDIVLHGHPHEYEEYFIPAFEDFDMPFFVAIGNHDTGVGKKALAYLQLFGDDSLNYYFDYGNCRFVLLDNVSDNETWDEALAKADKWLAATPDGYKKIVACHQPPATVEKWAYHAMGKEESKKFTDLMAKHRVNEVFLGHIHGYSTATLDSVSYTVSGGGGAELHDRYGEQGNVHHYIICDVTPDGIKQQVVRFREKD